MKKSNAEKFYENISKTGCVSEMLNEDKQLFKTIVLKFYEEINGKPAINNIDFTPHDEYHLIDIYEIIDTIFIKGNKSKDKITSKELLYLNLAILFHDVGMHEDELGATQRDEHAATAVNFVKNQLPKACGDKYYTVLGGMDGVKSISSICGAHSDANGGYVRLRLSEVKPFNEEAGKRAGGYKRLILLAVILRIADELDVCSQRINYTRERPITATSSKGFIESHKKHWQKCTLFDMPHYEYGKNAVILRIRNEGFFDDQCVNSMSENYDLINEHVQKLAGVNKEADNDKTIKKLLNGQSEKLQFECVVNLNKYEDARLKEKGFQTTDLIEICKNINFEIMCEQTVCLKWGTYYFKYLKPVREEFAKKLAFGKGGHIMGHKSLNYIGDNIPCIYDHMNFHKLMDSGEMQEIIRTVVTKSFGQIVVNEVGDDNTSSSIIIGMDSIGSRLAVMLGRELRLPVLSYASKTKDKVYPNIEIDVEVIDEWYKLSVKDKKHIYIICDNIYTFESISTCLKIIGQESINTDLIHIFCLFDRKPIHGDYFSDKSKRKPKYEELYRSFKIFPIFDKMKTNFVRADACIFCMLKNGRVK
ncbi:MAG: hypothetical protein HFE40_03370 [Clostridia bacterium]|nr:hypothetical protein [Clostridia bacterium]